MTRRSIRSLPEQISVPILAGFYSTSLAAAVGNDTETTWFWNLLIALIVLAVTMASAALPLAAVRQWTRLWRIGAAFPLLLLFIWLAVIAVSRLLSEDAHRLWPLEIFAWAMLNMIYMVVLMTAKRVFQKEDENKGATS